MRNALYAFSFLLISGAVFAQQENMMTQFWQSTVHTNPAFAGLDNRHQANVLYRDQWVGANGAPVSVMVNYAARLEKLHGGAGISYAYDEIGVNAEHKFLAHYAFHQVLKEKYVLSVGASAGFGQLKVTPSWVPPSSINDPLLSAASTATAFHLNAGVLFSAENWRIGFGATQLNQPSYRLSSGAAYNGALHSWLYGEYRWKLSEDVQLIPRVQLATDYVKMGEALSLMAQVKHFWGGINIGGLSYNNYIGAMIGYDIKGMYRIGYSYDYTTGQLYAYSKGTHEVLLAFALDGFHKKPVVLP